jgi:hypothetical protein
MAHAEEVKCKGKSCEHFRQYYVPQQSGTAFMPNFNLVDKRCAHPSVCPKRHFLEEKGEGINISALKVCPAELNE